MKVKKIVFVLTLSLFFSMIFAENLRLEAICSGLAKNPVTTGDFVQIKTINANGRQLKSSGNFIISPYGIMWKTLKPFPSCLVVTEISMIQTSANGKESVMSAEDNQIFKNIAATLRSVFAGDSRELKNHFIVEFDESDLGQNVLGNWKIILTPKDSTIAMVMKTLELTGSQDSDFVLLNSLEMQETSNNKICYEFSNQKYSKELTDDEKSYFKIK